MTLVVAGVLIVDGKLLLAQRERPAALAGLWELPGGKVESGETPAQALRRELSEELGVGVRVGERIDPPVRIGDDVELRAMAAELVSGEPAALDHRALTWVDAVGLTAMAQAGELVPADTEWLGQLCDLLAAARR